MPRKLEFHVVHASGEDDIHKAGDLNYHGPLAKGWVASRFCLYPQDIVIQLEGRARLRKIQILSHQFLIPTKIEFFVGDVPEGTTPLLENARYTRLGYVSLSDNEKTGFKARELKSVHVDAVGMFLRLNIHKNHINKHNLYNQVGIVAINVIGEVIRKPSDITDPEFQDIQLRQITEDLFVDVSDNRPVDKDPGVEGFFNKPDYISPLDDLAFDMYQDPEIAQIIRRLERKKQEAVLQERYEYAKKLKEAITELQKVGEKLGKMEVEKRQAVENEDYDTAAAKKVQIDEFRLQIYRDLNVYDLLEPTGTRHPVPVEFESYRQQTPPRLMELDRSSPPMMMHSPLPMNYDERPLPAMKSKGGGAPPPEAPPGGPATPHSERALPVQRPPPLPEEEVEPEINQEPEPMTEVDLREASTAIDVFGYPLVSKAYSKTWSYREDALLAVYKQMQELAVRDKEEAKTMMRAAIFLVKRGIDDKVYAVFKAALNLLRLILTDFVPKHKIPKQDISSAVERTLQNLFHKSGETVKRSRDDAKKFIFELAEFPDVKPSQAVPHECVKPIKLTVAPRLAQSRAEIVEKLYKTHGLNDGLTLDNMMGFCTVALNHNAGEVREVTERIIKQLYRDHGTAVKNYLPPDDEKARKNTLWRQLFEFFDKVDGKPSKSDLRKQKQDDEAKKQEEIVALQKQLQDLRQMNNTKEAEKENAKPAARKKPELKKPLPKKNPKRADEDEVSTFNTERICIFCSERNDAFTEEGLDIHYWKSCPMLKRCANCKQVVEIATYTDHVLTECEAKSNFGKCPRCSEAIPRAELDQHIADKTCNPFKPNMNHCPLCHENLSGHEDGWKDHLMTREGCKQNPRRLIALNKQPTGGAKGGARQPPSKISRPTAKKTPR
ncbi:centrosomal protein of 104 kDa-like isoform X2 [Littorina saxatilis]|uniref:centrosomal protein of 104 kDa-like isoform X2 n=1 Tax=Littorina saxatilis TaxID=31220 RepID=UPI0038B683D8